jgi:hypothetical protein
MCLGQASIETPDLSANLAGFSSASGIRLSLLFAESISRIRVPQGSRVEIKASIIHRGSNQMRGEAF